MFAEDFSHAIDQSGPLQRAIINHISGNVIAIRSHRTRKEYLWHIEQPRCLQHVESSHGVRINRARGIGLRGNRKHRAQVIDYRWSELLHHIQDMVEVPQVSPHQFHPVEYIAQPLRISADMENNRSLLAPIEQKTRDLSADKAGSAGNQYCHGDLLLKAMLAPGLVMFDYRSWEFSHPSLTCCRVGALCLSSSQLDSLGFRDA